MPEKKPTTAQLTEDNRSLRQQIDQLQHRLEELESQPAPAALRDESLLEDSWYSFGQTPKEQLELISRWDINGTLQYVNDAYCQFFGKSRQELLGQSIMGLVPDFNVQVLSQHIAQLKKLKPDKPVLPLLDPVTVARGELRWINWINRVIFDDFGRAVVVQSIGQDITPRLQADRALRMAHFDLEDEVRERTADLLDLTGKLQQEIEERKKAQQALEAQSDFLRLVLDTLPSAVFVKDRQSRYVMANKALADFFGLPEDTLIGVTDQELGRNSELQAFFQSSNLQVMDSQESMKCVEQKMCDGAGIIHDVETSLHPIVSPDGQCDQVLGVNIDFSERKELQRRIEEQGAFLRQIIDLLSNHIFVKDRQGRFILGNKALESYYGLPLEEILGKTHAELFPMSEHTADYQSNNHKVIETRQPMFDIEDISRDYTGKMHWYLTELMPVIGPDGSCDQVLGVNIDFTERKEMQRQIEEQRALLRQIIDLLPNQVFVKDRQGRLTLANKALTRFYSKSLEDILGSVNYENVSQEALETYLKNNQHVMDTLAEKLDIEEEVRDYSGARRTFLTSILPLRDADGTANHVLGVNSDVTERKKTQQALTEQSAFLRMVLDTLPNWVYIKDRQGRYILANKSFAATFNKLPEDVVGKTDEDLQAFNALQRHQFERGNQEVMDLLQDRRIAEEKIFLPDGNFYWAQTDLRPIIGADGTANQILGISTVITERKRAEEKLVEQQEFLKQVIDINPNPMFVRSRAGFYTMVNDAMARMLGIPASEIVGRHVLEISIDREQDGRFLAEDLHIMDGLQEVRINERAVSFAAGGRRWMQTTKRPLINKDGSADQVLAVLVDITDRKLMYQELEKQRAFLRQVIDINPNPMFVRDRNGIYSDVNAAMSHMMGLPAHEIVGKHVLGMSVDREQGSQFLLEDQQVMDTLEEIHAPEMEIVFPNGSKRWMQTVKRPLINEDGTADQVLAVSVDITERKLMLQELEEQRTFLRQVIDTTPSLIYVRDRSGRYTLVNETMAKAAGLSIDEMVGRLETEISPYAEQSARFERENLQVMDTLQDLFIPEECAAFPGGKTLWMQTTKRPIASAGGRVNQVLVSMVDITDRKSMLQELEKQRTFLRQVFDINSNPMFVLNRDGVYTMVNNAMARMVGRSASDIVGRHVLEISIDREQDGRYLEEDLHIIDTLEGVQILEREVTFAAGGRRWMQITKQPLINEDGTADQVLAVMVDITDRKSMLQELEQQRTYLRQVIDINPNMLFVRDREGRFTLVNEAMAKLMGCPIDEMLGKREDEISPYSEQSARFDREDAEVIGTLQDLFVPEEIATFPDGKTLWFQTTKRPIAAAGGRADQVLVSMVDITERKMMATDLDTQRSLLRQVIDSLPVQIFIKDSQGRYLLVNNETADFFNTSIEGVIGKRDTDFIFSGEDDAIFQQRNREVIESRQRMRTPEKRVTSADGQVRYLQTDMVPIIEPDGTCERVLGVKVDITARKQIEQELEKQRSLLRQVIDSVPVHIFIKDRDCRYQMVNKTLADFYNTTVENVLGKRDMDFIYTPEDEVLFQSRNLYVMNTLQGLKSPEAKVVSADGKVHYLQADMVPIIGADGASNQILGVRADVTARKLIEQELEEQRAFLRQVIDLDPNLIYVKDRQGKFILANQATADHYGLEIEDIVGKTDGDLTSNQAQENRLRLANLEVILAGKEKRYFEEKVSDPSGRTWWLDSVLRPLANASGEADRVLGVSVDITEQMFAREALRESEVRFRELFENAPIGIFEVDLGQEPGAMIILQANRKVEQIYGVPLSKITLSRLEKVMSQDSLPQILNALGKVRSGQPVTLEMIHKRADGTPFPVRLMATPPASRDNAHSIVIAQDITLEKQRRSAEEAIIIDRQRIAREIHDGVAQDLAALRVRVGFWHDYIDEDPAQMHNEADFLAEALRQNILSIRQFIFALHPVSLEKIGLFAALAEFVEGFGEMYTIETKLDICVEEVLIPGEIKTGIFQIVQEGLHNIGKHAKANRARVSLELQNTDALYLVVQDDGSGFDTGGIYQAALHGHMGLGQMRQKVNELGGILRIESQPGAGTTLTAVFTLS